MGRGLMQLTLNGRSHELELNFRRIQQAQRRLGLPVWPMGGLDGRDPMEFAYRLFAAAAELTLDEAYEAVGSDEDLELMGDAVSQLMEAYQPEKWKALLAMTEALMEAKRMSLNPPRTSAISGKSAGPLPAFTSDSPALTSANAQNGSGPISAVTGKRGKPRETTRLHA